MKKKHIRFMTGLMLAMTLLAGCSDKDSKGDLEAQKEKESQLITENQTKSQNITQQSEPSQTLQNENVYDGINRIAVTFCGDTSTQMGLSWYTPYHEDFNYGNDVQVLDKATLEVQQVEYEVLAGEAEYDENSMYHQTVVKGLLPGTKYYFRVGDTKANQWSEYGSFRTSAADVEEFSFVALTDTQSKHLPDAFFSADTMRQAVATAVNSAFIMHSGDFVNEGDEEELWIGQMNAAKDILLHSVIAPAVGNHEEEAHAFWQHFTLEHTNDHKTTGIYYSYDYGNVHFVVLDTNKENEEETSYIDDEQLEWLEADLKQARENGASWIIVNMHKGLYTLGEHADNEKFAGEDGVIYINTGAAGAKSYEVEYDLMPKQYYELFEYQASTDRDNDVYQNFAVVDVSEEQLTVTMYEMNQLAVDNQKYVIADFTIKNNK